MVGVATDVNGDYTLRINPEAKTLSASFIGYSEAEKTIMPGIGVYNFTLKPEARKLDGGCGGRGTVLPGSGI